MKSYRWFVQVVSSMIVAASVMTATYAADGYVAAVGVGTNAQCYLKLARISDLGGTPSSVQAQADISGDFTTIQDVAFLRGTNETRLVAVLGNAVDSVPSEYYDWYRWRGYTHHLQGKVVVYTVAATGNLSIGGAYRTITFDRAITTTASTVAYQDRGAQHGETWRLAGLAGGGFAVNPSDIRDPGPGWQPDRNTPYNWLLAFDATYTLRYSWTIWSGYSDGNATDVAGFISPYQDAVASIWQGVSGTPTGVLRQYLVDWAAGTLTERANLSGMPGWIYYMHNVAPLAYVGAGAVLSGGVVVREGQNARNVEGGFASGALDSARGWGGIGGVPGGAEVMGLNSDGTNLVVAFRCTGGTNRLYRVSPVSGAYADTGFSFEWAGDPWTVTASDGDAMAGAAALAPTTAGQLQVTEASVGAGEDGGKVTISVRRMGGTSGAASVRYATVDGTALAGADYVAATGTLSWADGEAADKSLDVSISDDAIHEGDEGFSVALSAATGAALGAPQQATVTITDNDPVPGVTLGLEGSPMAEAGGVAVVSATLSGASAQQVTVDLAFTGTATAAEDYEAGATRIVIQPGSLSGTVTLTAVQDAVDEPDETILVEIVAVANATETGEQQVTALIADDDLPPPGVLQFADVTYGAGEGGGTVTLRVTRTGGTAGAASVRYATVDGTAAAGTDYTTASGTLNWADGDAADKTFDVSVLNDRIHEEDETFAVVLSDATGATLGAPAQAVVAVADDDLPLLGAVLVQNARTWQVGTHTVNTAGGLGPFAPMMTLRGWVARDLDAQFVLAQQGDGGAVRVVELDGTGVPVPGSLRSLTGAIPGLVASALNDHRVLVQLGTGGPGFVAEFTPAWSLSRLTRIARSTAGLALRSLDGANILVQTAPAGAGHIWQLGANGTIVGTRMIYDGSVPGVMLRSLSGGNVLVQLGDTGPVFVAQFDDNWKMQRLLPIATPEAGWIFRALD